MGPMKTRLLFMAVAALPSFALGMSRAPGELEGVYIEPQEIMVLEADADSPTAIGDVPTTHVTNRLSITNDSGSGFDFHAELVFSYYHTCDLEGPATLVTRNVTGSEWTFRYTQPADELTGKRCILEIAVDKERVKFIDAENSCTDWCGARGYFDGIEFARKNRQDAD